MKRWRLGVPKDLGSDRLIMIFTRKNLELTNQLNGNGLLKTNERIDDMDFLPWFDGHVVGKGLINRWFGVISETETQMSPVETEVLVTAGE